MGGGRSGRTRAPSYTPTWTLTGWLSGAGDRTVFILSRAGSACSIKSLAWLPQPQRALRSSSCLWHRQDFFASSWEAAVVALPWQPTLRADLCWQQGEDCMEAPATERNGPRGTQSANSATVRTLSALLQKRDISGKLPRRAEASLIEERVTRRPGKSQCKQDPLRALHHGGADAGLNGGVDDRDGSRRTWGVGRFSRLRCGAARIHGPAPI